MFKLRQLRVEKFIYENNPDAFTDNSVVGQRLKLKAAPYTQSKQYCMCMGWGWEKSAEEACNYMNTQFVFPSSSSIKFPSENTWYHTHRSTRKFSTE